MGMKTTMGPRNTFVVSGRIDDADNETHDILVMSGPGRVNHVTFVSASALGSSDGIDLINAGVNGTAAVVVQASSNDLNGEEEFDGVNSALQDGDVLQIKADDYSAGIDIGYAIEIQKFSR